MTVAIKKIALALSLAGILTGSAYASTPWAATATQAISLSQLVSATDEGAAAAEQPLTVRVALKVRNQAALQSYVKNINNPSNALYGQSLTPAEFASTYGATTTQLEAVTGYLTDAGFTNIVVEPNRLLVSADGNVGKAAAAFNTPIRQYKQFGRTVFGNTAAAKVPASLSGTVAAVLGLNTIGQMKPTLVTKAQVKPAALPPLPVGVPVYDTDYTPKQFWLIYDTWGTPAASKTSIAIMAEGSVTGVISDLRIAEKAFGLPQVPLSVVQVGLASPDVSGADEFDLDTQYSTGMAGTVKELYIYATTSLSDSDLALEFSRWATDNKAKAASASLGECEVFPYIDGSMLVDDEVFLEAASQGQTFFASSGDTGAFCPVGVGTNGVPAGAPLVQYPASSPYVVGVGGTTVLTNANGTYDAEIAWYAGGGGISQFEGAPYWQVAANIASAKELNSRGVPDIAMDADPYSGALVYVNGVSEGVGGTSLSSPLALGVWARMLTANSKLGFGSLKLYGLYDGTGVTGTYPKGGFHDITIGDNGLYPATTGWDYTTGLGTLDVSKLYLDLR